MKDGTARVELNDRVFVLGSELAATLSAGNVIHACLDCDPSGREFHLDPDHTVAELLAAGAQPWVPPGQPSKVALVRVPILLAHHESKGG